jgi:hypothetical protein
MNDKEIFDLAETYGEWDDFGRWTFRDNDGLLRFVDSIVRTHTPEDIKKIERKWVGLTDDEFQACFDHADGTLGSLMYAIEAKLKEKNT